MSLVALPVFRQPENFACRQEVRAVASAFYRVIAQYDRNQFTCSDLYSLLLLALRRDRKK